MTQMILGFQNDSKPSNQRLNGAITCFLKKKNFYIPGLGSSWVALIYRLLKESIHTYFLLGMDYLERALSMDVKKSEFYARAQYGLGMFLWFTRDVEFTQKARKQRILVFGKTLLLPSCKFGSTVQTNSLIVLW